MGSKGSYRLLACGVVVLPLLASSAAPAAAHRARGDCTHGASSVRVTVVDGRVTTTKPATSGCIPR
jgi:hypothetical protein